MTALDDGVVGFAALADAQQAGAEGLEDAAVERGQLLGALAAEFLAPVGLVRDVVAEPVGAQPEDDEHHEGQAVGEGLLRRVREEAGARAHAAGGPLVRRQADVFVVGVRFGRDALAVEDLLEIGLEETQRLLLLPEIHVPSGALPCTAPLRLEPVAPDDVANGPYRQRDAVALEADRSVAGALAHLHGHGLEGSAGLGGRGVWAAAEVVEAAGAADAEAAQRLAHDVARGVEGASHGANRVQASVRLEQLLACGGGIEAAQLGVGHGRDFGGGRAPTATTARHHRSSKPRSPRPSAAARPASSAR
jgi:hypothetical protein